MVRARGVVLGGLVGVILAVGPAARPAAADAGSEVLALVGLPAPATSTTTTALAAIGLDVTALTHLPSVVVRGTPAELDAARLLPGVTGVWPDRQLELYDD